MIFSIFTFVIGLVPIILGYSLFFLYEKSKLTYLIFFYMLCITLWQVDVAVLYLNPYLNHEAALVLFKVFRIGATAALPLTLLITYTLYTKSEIKYNKYLDRIVKLILNKTVLTAAFASTVVVYVINLTDYGISGLETLDISSLQLAFYYPEYGPLAFVYIVHLASLLLLLILLVAVSRSIVNKRMQSFFTTFVILSLLLFLFGVTNFIPGYQMLISSIAVLIYSIFVLLSFIKMYNDFNLQYLEVVQRQNKLDYIGNMTASLIHEVKNSLSVINGYSQFIQSSQKLEPETNRMMNHVIASGRQLSDLVDAYHEFLRNDTLMEFESKNVIRCIKTALQTLDNSIRKSNISIKMLTSKKAVYAYINETYLTQALINLIKNAIEAIPEDSERKLIKFEVTDYDNSKIIIDLFDSGIGIAKGKWDKVFLPYNSTKTAGSGIGLPFCSKIIFAHRGLIDIVESNNLGTHFRIQLPKSKFTEISRAGEAGGI